MGVEISESQRKVPLFRLFDSSPLHLHTGLSSSSSSGGDFWGEMFGLSLSKAGVILERKLISGDSSSSSAKYYCLFTRFQNQNVVTPNSRVTSSIFYSTNNRTCSDSSNSFVVSYLINSCGLSRNQAIKASKKLKFKTTFQPDSVLTLLRTYGFTDSHISKVISKDPSILSSNPDKTLKPKFDFFNSKRLCGIDLASFISNDPAILWHSFSKVIIPSFDVLKSIVQSDQNVITMIKRRYGVLSTCRVKRLMVNLELLRNHGVPENNISNYLINQPASFIGDAEKFKDIVEKVKQMGFNHLQTSFLSAIHGLASRTEANWKRKMDVYKTWGWSEDQIHTAFRKNPGCMMASEEKIMAVMNFLVNEMAYDSSIVAENPRVISCSLKGRIIPRCSVIRVLVCKKLIKENISINSLSTMADESFLEVFVKKFEKEIPQLMKVLECQLNYQEILQN